MSIDHLAGPAGPADGAYDADIVILTLDRTDETLAAIASARAQSGIAAHIFILDQGSRPEGVTRLRQAVEAETRVTLLAVPENLGVAAGRNLLAGLGHGRVIIGLDNDAVFPDADTAARLVRALDAEPGLAAIGCRILTGDGKADDRSSWGYPSSLLRCAGESFDTVTFVGAGHAIRRTAWQQAGGYDAKLFFCWEEYDFCLRAIALGWRIRYRGDITIHHAVSAERRVTWTASRWFYFARNRLYIERKLNRPWPALLPRTAGYLAKGLLLGQPSQTVRAISDAIRMPVRGQTGQALPASSTFYLRRNDRAHRGSVLRRLVTEVLNRPDAASAINQ